MARVALPQDVRRAPHGFGVLVLAHSQQAVINRAVGVQTQVLVLAHSQQAVINRAVGVQTSGSQK